MKGLRVLVVEDDPVISTDIQSLLRSEGYQVVGVAKNALRAYDLLKVAKPDLAILDIYLGTGPGGIEIAEAIHEHYHIPYIFLTSYADEATLNAAQEHGPYGYLVKPFQDRTLLTTLAVAWSTYQRVHSQAESFSRMPASLTAQEEKICRLLYEGLSYKQIAEHLFISMNTLKFHTKNIYSKCCVSGRAELTAFFINQSR